MHLCFGSTQQILQSRDILFSTIPHAICSMHSNLCEPIQIEKLLRMLKNTTSICSQRSPSISKINDLDGIVISYLPCLQNMCHLHTLCSNLALVLVVLGPAV